MLRTRTVYVSSLLLLSRFVLYDRLLIHIFLFLFLFFFFFFFFALQAHHVKDLRPC
jgi:hypothetical protein